MIAINEWDMISGINDTFLNKDKISIINIIWNQLNKNSNNTFSIKLDILNILIKNNEIKEIKMYGTSIFKKLVIISTLKIFHKPS